MDSRVLLVGLVVSAAAHLLLFRFAPDLQPPEYERVVGDFEAVEVRGPVRIPPPPDPVVPPETPEAAAVEVTASPDIRSPGAGGDVDVSPPPPPSVDPSGWSRPSYIPHEVAPRPETDLPDPEELSDYYPEGLAEAGVEGLVELWLYVDERGEVERVRVFRSSGHEALDRAARRIVEEREYLPAMHLDRPVAVWVRQRVCFVIVDGSFELSGDEKCRDLLAGG